MIAIVADEKPQSTKLLRLWKCGQCGQTLCEMFLPPGGAILKRCRHCKKWNLLEQS
jgi:hypothetical protein